MASLKHSVIAAGFRAISMSGADRWLASFARGIGAVLMFHHVRPASLDPYRPNRLLEITPEHLDLVLTIVRRSGWEIIGIDEMPERLARGQGRFVVLTFDDGYRDNRDHALPILRKHSAPWSLFVTADYASGQGSLWWLELEEAIRHSERISVDGRFVATVTTREKAAAFAALYAQLRAGAEPDLRAATARLCEEAGFDRASLVRRLCLSWDELLDLSSAEPNLTIGAHTISHSMLAKWDEGAARKEIVEGREKIAGRLGREVRHLAYPVGDPTSAGPREFRLAREAGYASAVTTRPGHLFAPHASRLMALPRISINGLYQTEAATRALLSGVPFLLWNRGRQVLAD